MVNKLIRDGKVAVLVSPGYGAGWSSWNPEYVKEMLFDAEIVEALLEDRYSDLEKLAEEKWPNAYISIDDLRVEWVPVGTEFRIEEYDGSERLVTREEDIWHWHTA